MELTLSVVADVVMDEEAISKMLAQMSNSELEALVHLLETEASRRVALI